MAGAAQKVEETPVEVNFDDAFARLAGLGDDQQPDLTTPETEKEPETPPEAAEKPETGETPPASDETPPAEPPKAAETPPAPTPAPKADEEEVLQRLARLVKEEPAPQQSQQPQQPQQPQLFTQEEQEYLTNYEKEWPDIAKAESLRRRAEAQQLVSYVFAEVAKEMRPLMETVQVLAQRTHLSDLTSKVDDYEQVREGVISWVEQQPTYLQVAYKHVIENGTVEEVADLVGRYKRETGVSAQPATAPAPRKPDTELPPATKQAAAALAPVSSKRSAVAQAVDPEDFESAFAAFASKM